MIPTALDKRRVYRPRGACRAAFECRDPELLLSGSAGTGKSRVLLEKLFHMALLNPGMKGLIARRTQVSLTSTTLDTWRKYVAVEALTSGEVTWYGGSGAEPAQYRFRNGSRITVAGLDRRVKIMSSEFDVIFVDEATEISVDDWEFLSSRLRNGRVSFQQLMAACNPDKPTHWLKQRADAGATTIFYSTHRDNPRVCDDDGVPTGYGQSYLARLGSLTGVRRQRLFEGKWVAAEGTVWPEFDPAVHLVDKPRQPPPAWPRIWTVDFGFTHPFVCQHWAIGPDGVAYRYREFYGTKTLVEDWAAKILRSVTKNGDGVTWKEPKPERIIADHDAEDRATLEKHLGLPTVPAVKTVSDGLQAVSVRLRDERLFFVRDALDARDPLLVEAGRPTCTEEEIGGYVWNPAKDAPVKEMDDGCDTTRYLVADQDLRARYRIRT